MNIKEVLRDELAEISLSEQEEKEIKNQAEGLLLKLKSFGLNGIIGGSLAKETMIKKDIQDVDIFIVFEKSIDIEAIEKALIKSRIIFDRLHGSRDYFQVKKDNLAIELIPVMKNKEPEKAENSTDLSLMHVDYVAEKISRKKYLADEIKLAKAFCYAQDCYGAESYIKGFSGYSLELLVIYFKGFVKFLKGIQKKRIIDIEKAYKNENQIKEELNESKLSSPIILIDPTYKKRNTAAGLSKETFERFLSASKKLLKAPSQDFFEHEIIDVEMLQNQAKKNKAELFEINFSTEKQEGDIAATKMKKFFNFIVNEIKKNKQDVILSKFVYEEGQEAIGYIIIKKQEQIEIMGPPARMKEAIKKFKIIHKKTYAKKGIVCAKKAIDLQGLFNHLKRFEDEMGVRFYL